MTTALWILAILLMGLGVAGAVLPVLPGPALVVAGALLGAWIDDFTEVGWLALGLIIALALAAFAIDALAAAMGARRAGASRAAIGGALIGTVLGVLSGLWGLLLFPLLGAIAGQYWVERDAIRARQVGVATWVGLAIGLVAKVVLTFVMIGVFVGALLIG